MLASRRLLSSLPALALLALLLLGGCASQPDQPSAQPTAPPTPSTTIAPTTTAAVSGPLTPAELAWLDAVEGLHIKMNRVFSASPSNLTPAALRSLAGQLRGCSRELARLGAPSDRLAPVAALARQGCRAYDQGAECFATAARIGVPVAGSDAARRHQQAIDCGFAASGTGGQPLVQAVAKGAEIRAAAG